MWCVWVGWWAGGSEGGRDPGRFIDFQRLDPNFRKNTVKGGGEKDKEKNWL